MPELVWHNGHLPYLTDDTAHSVRIAFTTRLGGVSAAPFQSLNLSEHVGDDRSDVTANARLVEEAVGFAPRSLSMLHQMHGTDVVEATPGTCGSIGSGDVVVATDAGVTAGVLAADCVPVLLAGPNAVAAVHAGWRGLVAGAIESGVERLGAVEHAWVGPSIRSCCYEVGPEVVAAFEQRRLPVAAPSHVDTQDAAVAILRRAGIEVTSAGLCTGCDERFFSHRREGPTGRQGAFIAWA